MFLSLKSLNWPRAVCNVYVHGCCDKHHALHYLSPRNHWQSFCHLWLDLCWFVPCRPLARTADDLTANEKVLTVSGAQVLCCDWTRKQTICMKCIGCCSVSMDFSKLKFVVGFWRWESCGVSFNIGLILGLFCVICSNVFLFGACFLSCLLFFFFFSISFLSFFRYSSFLSFSFFRK